MYIITTTYNLACTTALLYQTVFTQNHKIVNKTHFFNVKGVWEVTHTRKFGYIGQSYVFVNDARAPLTAYKE